MLHPSVLHTEGQYCILWTNRTVDEINMTNPNSVNAFGFHHNLSKNSVTLLTPKLLSQALKTWIQ